MNEAIRPIIHADEDTRYRLLVEAVTDYAIYMLSPEGLVSSWNPGAQRYKGYERSEIIGEHFSRFYTEEDRRSDLPARALRTAATEGRFEQEGWRVRKDGSRFWAQVVIDPIRDSQGALLGYAKITRDVTERKLAQEELQKSEERFRMLVQGVTDYAIYMLDPEGRVTNWNTGAERIKGYSEAEIVGRRFSKFYTGEERAAGVPARSLEASIQQGRFEREGWRVRKSGERFWANVVIDPIHGQDGVLLGFAKVTRDLSERHAAAAELEKARAALVQSQKMEAIGQLTGGIAHDFNNLLTVIVNGLDLVARSIRDPKALKVIDSMHRAAERGSSLNRQLLAFARRQPLRPERTSASAVIKAFEAVLRRALGEMRHMEISLSTRPCLIEVDVPQFEAALLNLVVNARDAMPDGGKLSISTRNVKSESKGAVSSAEPRAYVSIAVMDSGSGMSEDVRARAFEPFFTTKEVGKGTGLGLSQVYGFVHQSGGRVEINSEIGRGTYIRMLLPTISGDAEPVDDENGFVQESRDTLGTVLIVEDEPDVLEIAIDIFESLGYDVLSATNAAAAIEVIRAEAKIDVLFSDVVMPGAMNGVELARQARQLRPQLKVLLASGYPMSALSGEILQEDISFISKPYRWTELDEKLRALRSARRV